jgi:hypothetical protein
MATVGPAGASAATTGPGPASPARSLAASSPLVLAAAVAARLARR